jgi:hypothetical protein
MRSSSAFTRIQALLLRITRLQHVLWEAETSAPGSDVCCRMPTYADVCQRMLAYAEAEKCAPRSDVC